MKLKKNFKIKTPATEKPSFGKKDGLDKTTINNALKCSQLIINRIEDYRVETEKAQTEREEFMQNITKIESVNEKLKIRVQKFEQENEFKDDKIQRLDQETVTLFQEGKKLREEHEDERKKSRELDYETKYLAHNLEEEKKIREFTEEELKEQKKQNEMCNQQYMKMEVLLAHKDDQITQLKHQIECFESKIESKQQIIESLNDGMKQQHGIQTNLQNASTQEKWFVMQENNDLKMKMSRCRQCLDDMKQQFHHKENNYRQTIALLEKELKMSSSYENVSHKLQKLQQSWNPPPPPEKSTQSTQHLNSKVKNEFYGSQNKPLFKPSSGLQSTLQELADGEQKRKAILSEMQSKSMHRKEKILQAKYDNKELASAARTSRKLNKIAIQSEERKSLLTRLQKLEDENKKIASESKEIYFDMSVCREENTKLVHKIKNYEAEINSINGEAYTNKVRREENTKLARRIQVYEEELQKLKTEVAAKEEWKEMCKELELNNKDIMAQLKGSEKEKTAMEQTMASLQKDIEFYRKSSMMISNSSCCFDLKVSKQQLEKQVGELETHVKALEAKLKISLRADEELERIKEQLATTQNDLTNTRNDLKMSKHDTKVTKNELEDCKIEIKEYKEENSRLRRQQQQQTPKRTFEQPNVNVHVHLDPKQILGDHTTKTRIQSQHLTTQEEKQENPAVSEESEEKIHELYEEIEMLRDQNRELKERIGSFDDGVCVKEGINEEELRIAKRDNVALVKENKQMKAEIFKLESQITDFKKKIKEYKAAENEMQQKIEDLNKALEEFEEEKTTAAEEYKCQIAELQEKLQALTNEEKQYKTQIVELRQKLQAQSNDDMTSLRNKIQDLTLKKEKSESLIEKLKEDKAELQMSVERLQREIDNLRQQFEFNETDRAQQRRNAEAVVEKVQDTTTSSKKNNKPGYPEWLDSRNNEKDMAKPSPSKNKEKPCPTTAENKPELKKPEKPLWLTSTPKKTEKAGQPEQDDSDDDFLGIRPKNKQNSKAHQEPKKSGSDEMLDSYLNRLDTSNRRHVAKRNVSKTKQQDDSEGEEEEGNILNYSDNRRGKPKQSANVTEKKENKSVDQAEDFLQQFKTKSKQKENEGEDLSFLTLDDIVIPPPKLTKAPPLSQQYKRPKPVRNAEFLI